ncbi:AAA family ATPase [Rhodobacteraceae bacterium F11138]|nr:AAA family ATPase [Rhodobacteraceae bacterium F11138]
MAAHSVCPSPLRARAVDPKTCQGEIAPGVDVRGHGGMVIAPPSIKPGAEKPYRWLNPPGLFEVAHAPQWVLDMLPRRETLSDRAKAAAPRSGSVQIAAGGTFKSVEDYKQLIACASSDGTKHSATRDIAASLAAQGVKEDFATGLIQAVCPVWDANLQKSISSAYAKFRPNGTTGDIKPERESRFYSAVTLKGRAVPARQWLVHDLVPQKTVTLFSGDGGTGKSLLAFQLAVAVTAQTAWIGRAVSDGGTIFLSAEDDDDELHRRLDDILRAEGRDYDDTERLTMRSLAGEDALLAVDTQLALMQSALFEELDKRAAEEAPVLIVIDTLADVYPANENDRAKVRQFVGILRGLAIKRNCAVMLLGHPSLTGLNSGSGTSGSTAWNNSVRSRLYLSRIADNGYEADPDARVLSTKKANYGRIGGEINLRWDAGVFVAEAQPTGLDALAAGAKGERVFLKLLDALTAQGRYVSASPGPTYAPTQFASHPEAEGCTKRALKSAMDTLFGRDMIVIASHGIGAKARSHIARKGADDGQK